MPVFGKNRASTNFPQDDTNYSGMLGMQRGLTADDDVGPHKHVIDGERSGPWNGGASFKDQLMQVVSVTASSGTTSPVGTRTTQVAVMPILPDNVILCDRRGSGRSGSAAP